MTVISSEKRICPCCMEEHEVQTVILDTNNIYKGKHVRCNATYLFCEKAQKLFADESLIKTNWNNLKNAYNMETA